VLERNPHLREYLESLEEKPRFLAQLSREMDTSQVNILYPLGDPVFIHIQGTRETGFKYHAIEPRLTREETEKARKILDLILEQAPGEEAADTEEKLKKLFDRLLEKNTAIIEDKNKEIKKEKTRNEKLEETKEETSKENLKEKNKKFRGKKDRKDNIKNIKIRKDGRIEVTARELERLRHHIDRNIIGHGPIEPLIRDPYLEDVYGIGPQKVYVFHKIFGMIETNIHFNGESELDEWMRNMGERIGRPASEIRPIVDGALSDGSRINIIYSPEVSRQGRSFTLRKFSKTPLSITQLIKWNSLSPEMAAYLWLCLENGINIFISGETASGKTTALNAILPFIPRESKIYSVEDTAEVVAPQDTWQQMITRDTGPPEGRVDMFTLLKLALRSRPNYIIVGEIRGVEGAVAFQAMQSGNSVLATFHASSVRKLIQRLTGDPIRVPVTFIDNLNVALILQAVYRQGKSLRRCISLEEIEGYQEESGGVVTRAVFQWDSVTDVHEFRGMNNSYILENLVAAKLGYSTTKKIYQDLEERAKILAKAASLEILDYHQVLKLIWAYQENRELPFSI